MTAPLEDQFERRITEEVRRLGLVENTEYDRHRLADKIVLVAREVYGDSIAGAMFAQPWQALTAADFVIKAKHLEKQGKKMTLQMQSVGFLVLE